MTFDQLMEFEERMRERAQLCIEPDLKREYEQMAALVEELLLSREQFGAVADTRFLIG